jgi:hypothetical protein
LDGASLCFERDVVEVKYLDIGKNGILIPQKVESVKVGESKDHLGSIERKKCIPGTYSYKI